MSSDELQEVTDMSKRMTLLDFRIRESTRKEDESEDDKVLETRE